MCIRDSHLQPPSARRDSEVRPPHHHPLRPKGGEGHGGAPFVQAVGRHKGRLDRAPTTLPKGGGE
eukprot:1075705-Alexandrium_andersonii.AAC.1